MRLIFATFIHAQQHSLVLNKCDARDRLLSYFEAREMREGFIEHYVETGLPLPGLRKQKTPGHATKTRAKLRRLALAERLARYQGYTE